MAHSQFAGNMLVYCPNGRSSMARVQDQLAKSFGDTGLVLCLGAGVSAASGIPDWKDLLCRIGAAILPAGGSEVVGQLIHSGFGLPAIASIIQAKWRESHPKSARQDFAEIVRDALYRDLPAGCRTLRDLGRADLVTEIRERNPTLRAVAAFCVAKTDPCSFCPNVGVRAIVNLSYDALLRFYVRFRYDTILLRTIERPDASPRLARIPVYQPHGFLHFNPKYCGDLDSETPDQLILTEQEYFDFFNRPLSLFTYTMLFLLREHSFLFIGTGLKDENVRRLLHYSKQERLAAFRRRGKTLATSRADRHFVILRRRSSLVLNDLTETSLRTLGVKPIWTSTHEDIPTLLGQIYQSSGVNRWSDVY
jgi:hypothetical protein